mgnify:CR=1 FL=1
MTSRSEQLVKVAKRRAAIVGLLNSNPAVKYSLVNIAEALGDSAKDVDYAVQRLVESDLVNMDKVGNVKWFYAKDRGAPKDPQVSASSKAKAKNRVTDKDVELVIGGVLIVVGRSAESGRLRIVITES